MTQKVYIGELARAIDRRPSTIRVWCRHGRLPKRLMPAQDGGWRFWTPAQVTGIAEWMRHEGMAPGSGLMNFDPTEEQTAEFLARLRVQRSV